ncbi:MAG: tRNA (adenosine(37)-N6)-threonylcarbamoyltransferase complex dimerization subunit type 1 TsaB [Byssovorax sp.]
MKLLALSTTTARGSAAVLLPGKPPCSATYVDLVGHAERIFHAIDEALGLAGIDRAELSAIACDIGPGSFTGVRVGLSSAKGIALALGLPLVGVSSLEAMAEAAFERTEIAPGDHVLSAIDAKKNEVFWAAWARGPAGLVAVHGPAAAPRALPALAITGQAAPAPRLHLVGEVLATLDPAPSGLLRGDALDLPDAAAIGRIALRRLEAGDRGDPAEVEPLYLRDADARPMAAAPAGKRDPSGDIG